MPVDRCSAKCDSDAFLEGNPKNANNFSKWSQSGYNDGLNHGPFLFTYKDECYMTETQAFCGSGNVARFLVPYKSPFSVPRDYRSCLRIAELSKSVKFPCRRGFVEDENRNICVSESLVEFD